MPFTRKSLVGQTFERLTVVDFAGKQGAHRLWKCVCVCGGETRVKTNDLRGGKSKSCGCLRRERASIARIHGDSKTPEYRIWQAIKNRCLNPKEPRFSDYGRRGIMVCDRWLIGENGINAYVCFLTDMGRRPSSSHSIERRENNGSYSKENCIWATTTEQSRNQRRNVMVCWNKKIMVLADAIAAAGMHRNKRATIYYHRVERGLSDQAAFDHVVGNARRNRE